MGNDKKFDLKRGIDFIGVTCVFYCHDGKGNVLLHKRSKNCRDEIGKWDCGGGSMEHGETFEECVTRELKEEYCIEPIEMNFVGVNNVLRDNDGKKSHWIAAIYSVKVDPKKVAIGEPDRMEEIGWFSEDNFPQPLHSMFLEHFQMVKRVFPSF